MSVQLLHELVLSGVDATRRLGAMLAESFPPQAVIGLNGTLGAGKTFLARSIAEAIGVPPSDATSPTFTLIQAYRNSGKTVYHIDAYRVADVDEFLDLGVEELMDEPGAWVIVEWANRMGEVFPEETLWIDMEVVSVNERRVKLSGRPEFWTPLLKPITS